MALAKGARAPKTRISYQLIRNVTSPEEKENGIVTYFANVPAFELRRLNTNHNLRDYIPGSDDGEGNERKRNSVHKAIANTIDSESDRFINRNGGVTITCSSIDVNDKEQTATLEDASVINGAQTRGEILRFMKSVIADGESEDEIESPFHVRAEIIVDPSHQSVVETAIARNTASPVKSISQAGGRGQLDELDRVIKKAIGRNIKKSETEGGDLIDTFLVLQATRLLMPVEVSENETPAEVLRPYKQKAQCLEDFTTWYDNRKSDPAAARKYEFTLQMASTAIEEFEYWQTGGMWNNKNIRSDTKQGRAFKRNGKGGPIVWVAPGIVFPVLGAMRQFVEHVDGKWVLNKPEIFEESELVDAALEQFRGHETNPMWMGRSAAAYSALGFVTRTAYRAAQRMNS